jgi:hypothetical protein
MQSTGVGFEPDWVWIKTRSNADNMDYMMQLEVLQNI